MGAVVIGRPPAGGGGAAYTHIQTTPAATWTVEHNLGLKPAPIAVLVDSYPDGLAYCDVAYPDSNPAVITLPSAESGRATVA
jgi:hypothetical protein